MHSQEHVCENTHTMCTYTLMGMLTGPEARVIGCFALLKWSLFTGTKHPLEAFLCRTVKPFMPKFQDHVPVGAVLRVGSGFSGPLGIPSTGTGIVCFSSGSSSENFQPPPLEFLILHAEIQSLVGL